LRRAPKSSTSSSRRWQTISIGAHSRGAGRARQSAGSRPPSSASRIVGRSASRDRVVETRRSWFTMGRISRGSCLELAWERPMKRLVLESTAPFQGLPELVAYDEGLFAREGLDVVFADRDAGAEKRRTRAEVTDPRGLDPFTSHGRLFEQGQADMYNACEWGN